MERAPDNRPLYAVGALVAVLALAFAVPASRAWLSETVLDPLRAQADPAPGLREGYSLVSLAVWALVGGVLAWALYEIVFVRAGFEPDRAFFLSLAPALVVGPLFHAALLAGVLPPGSVAAYLASEPLVYLTVAAFAGIGLALGRATRQPILVPLAWGALGVVALLVVMLPMLTPQGARLGGVLLMLAIVPALALGYAFWRWRRREPLDAVIAVVGAHALDGATTWMVLRDPFALGFVGFGERNPVSLALVNMSNGWPYFALKLALPLVLLSMLRADDADARAKAFLLFAVFVLGFGPGMSNLLQVIFG